MTPRRLLAVAVGIGLAVIVATAVFEVVTFIGLKGSQHTFAVSQKASTATRVQTVSQRCDLTALDLSMARRTDPSVAHAYAASLTRCRVQLKSVKAINAATPNPDTEGNRHP